MKCYALLLLVAATAGCHKDDPAPDPFLGHWQGELTHYYRYDSSGKVSNDSTDATVFTLDITADSVTQKSLHSNQRYKYKRTDEEIFLPVLYNNPKNYSTWYARALTSTSFTMETNYPLWRSTRQTTAYHR